MLGALAASADTFDDDSAIAAVVYNPLKGPVGFKADSEDEISASEDLFAAASSPRSLMNSDLDLLSDFVSEVKEHIENINDSLLALENNPEDSDLLNAVFRVFHTQLKLSIRV